MAATWTARGGKLGDLRQSSFLLVPSVPCNCGLFDLPNRALTVEEIGGEAWRLEVRERVGLRLHNTYIHSYALSTVQIDLEVSLELEEISVLIVLLLPDLPYY